MLPVSTSKTPFWNWLDRAQDSRGVPLPVKSGAAQNADTVCVGIDVGGANLKFAVVGKRFSLDENDSSAAGNGNGNGNGNAGNAGNAGNVGNASDKTFGADRGRSVPFALWKNPEGLAGALVEAISQLGLMGSDRVVFGVTMTGELADCFATKAEGVRRIVQECESTLGQFGSSIEYYSQSATDFDSASGSTLFVGANQAIENWSGVAAANWHALATLVSCWMEQSNSHTPPLWAANGLVLDLGSTTLDLTPIQSAKVAGGKVDYDRLGDGQLVYTGVGRSPLSCILPEIEFQTKRISLAQELFATSADIYLVTGDVREDPTDLNTADGRPATIQCATQRIARMFCSDASELPVGLIQAVALQAKESQLSTIQAAIKQRLLSDLAIGWIAICGQGEFLLRQAIQRCGFDGPVIGLSEQLGAEFSPVAPAFAVAALLKRQG